MEDDEEPTGRAKGGLARAEALSVNANEKLRNEPRPPMGNQGHHKGNFKKDFGIDVDCYVLDDEAKTAVISQRGMGEALGLSTGGGSRLPRFVRNQSIAPYVGPNFVKN